MPATKIQPSPKQVETFSQFLHFHGERDAKIVAEMDSDDSTMLIIVEEDGARSFARFGIDGAIIGDWVW